MSKNILGLDLGTNSIGWALISTEDNQPQEILGMGCRIIPLTTDESNQFSKGQAISKNADRTIRRTARKGYDRYQMRRAQLTLFLREHEMLPDRMDENIVTLWKMRADAATPGCQLSLKQIGRVLYHLNQKRGYKHAKADHSNDKQTQYVASVNQRYSDLCKRNQTIGQYFYEMILGSEVKIPNHGPYYTFRTKDQVYPRKAYEEEFDRIMAAQKIFYPEVLTDEIIDYLRNHIIFYQRKLRSCKHLVSLCEFELKPYKKDGRIVYGGPKCAPRTSPLAQLCAVWEATNNITLRNRKNEELLITLNDRKAIVKHMLTHEKLTVTDLNKILHITKDDGWYANKAVGKGLKGNTTLCQLRKALDDKYDNLLHFDIELEDTNYADITTGEVIQIVSPKVEKQPLFQLWHTIYSIDDSEELAAALRKNFNIDDEEVIDNLCKIDFKQPGYANKSHKFIRKLLPYLMQGYMYSEACELIGVNHSNSLTKTENENRPLKDHLPLLQKNELRQPVVEKILNQMIIIVNALHDRYGQIDEIRVELARELKQSREERNEAFKSINKRERDNKRIAERITACGLTPNRNRIIKYRLWEECEEKCFYCGEKIIKCRDFLAGTDDEVEHIIPKSVLFDNSYSNKVCVCKKCNGAKGNLTAIEFMERRGPIELEAYIKRVDEAFQAKRISKTKRDHLLWYLKDIPQDFIERQLRQSQYIARKAVEILQGCCRNVWTTCGSVTDFLRHQWGYDEILHMLNYERYAAADYTENVERNGVYVERIKGWSKRMDHRHHAIDALTIALTRQSYIQRLNTLNASRPQMYEEVKETCLQYNKNLSLLQNWINIQPHFSVEMVSEKVDGILVSFRAGQKTATPGKRYTYKGGRKTLVQKGIWVPRGPLSEDKVYGKLNDKYIIKYPLVEACKKKIVDPSIEALVKARLAEYRGDAVKAFVEPLYSAEGMMIRSVKCEIINTSLEPVRFDEQGNPIGYVIPGNNHHVAIYRDEFGKYSESIVSFWQAVKRKMYGIPVVIENPSEIWSHVIDKDIPQDILNLLPADKLQFIASLQINDMFILGMDEAEYEEAMNNKDYRKLNKYLYRVQTLSSNDYRFRLHIETTVDDKYDGVLNIEMSSRLNKLKRIRSMKSLFALSPHKVKVNILGEISEQ